MQRPALPIAAALGNTVEWFDFAVYGYFAHAIGAAFFPSDRPSLQMVSAFGVFAVGYLMRPVGGLLLGPIGDQWGRRVLLLISVFVMGCCSLAIALLPTTAQIGPSAALLLVLLRMLQGLSVGAEYSGAISWSVETAPGHRRAFFSSITASGATVGFIAGSAAAALVSLAFSAEAIEAGAWRWPFALGALLSFVVLLLRRGLEDSRPGDAASGWRAQFQLLFQQWPAMVRLVGSVALGTAIFYLAAVYYVDVMVAAHPEQAALLNGLTALVQVFSLLLALLGGYLADRWAPLPLLRRSLAVQMLALVPGFLLLASGSIAGFVWGQALLLLPTFFYSGITPYLHASFFPGGARCGAFSFSYSLSVALFGGSAPLVVGWMVNAAHWSSGPLLYLVLLAVLAWWAWSRKPPYLEPRPS